MRKLLVGVLVALLWGCASTPELPPAAGFSKVDFISEVASPGLQKLLLWDSGRFYYSRKDGAIQVIDSDGSSLILQAKDSRGKPLLQRPEAIALGNNTLYVADSATHQIVMFSPDGKHRGNFGSRGSRRGQLDTPRGIAYYDGVLYVADSANGRIQLYGDNGVFLATLEVREAPENLQAQQAKLPYELKKPGDIEIDANGNIYVLDGSDNLVKVYAQNGKYLRHLAIKGSPTEFALSNDGIYMADQASYTIQKFSFDGTLSYYFGSKGKERSQFLSISGLVLAGERKIAVGDQSKEIADLFQTEESAPIAQQSRDVARTSVRILNDYLFNTSKIAWIEGDALYAVADDDKYTIVRLRNGLIETSFAVKGLLPGAIAAESNGSVWVVDKKQQRIVHLDTAGNILNSFGSEGSGAGQFDEPSDITLSSKGLIFVADPGNHWVQVFSREGVFLSAIRTTRSGRLQKPSAIAIDPNDNLYILDSDRGIVASFSAKGEQIAEFGNDKKNQSVALNKPLDLMATHDEIYVLEPEEIKVFNQQGKFVRSFGSPGKGEGQLTRPSAIVAIDATTFAIADTGAQKIQTFATLHKPAAPARPTARGSVHAVELSWDTTNQPYTFQYVIYRSSSEEGPFTRIATKSGSYFNDPDLQPQQRYYYRIASESNYGHEGLRTEAVGATTEKYSPPLLDEISVDAHEWHLKLSWKLLEAKFVKNYLIYQKREGEFVKIAETIRPEYIRESLAPNTNYSFYVSTLSVDGIESEKRLVNATTLSHNKAPLEIETIALSDIFSNTYKLYEKEGLGRVKLTNNTAVPMEKIKVSFSIKNYMDFPSETQLESLAPGESKEFTLKAVFNNNILTVTEDTPVQTELIATYFEDGLQKVYSRNQSVNLYEKHRMTWNERGRFAAFVTPKDPAVLDYARGIASQFADRQEPVQWASAIFAGLGISGISYIPDPTNPYQITSGATDFVDFIQYPRETLERKSGDCDDLVALYTSSLESMGITTRVVEVPGHMLMMLSTGITADEDGYTMDGMYVIQDGVLWIPVETTLIGSSFVKAWEVGSETYSKWHNKQQLTLLNIHEEWGNFKPASLPMPDQKPVVPSRKAIEERYPDQQMTMLHMISRTRMHRYLQALEQNPQDLTAQLQAGIVSARGGDYTEAHKYFESVLSAEPGNAKALNNRGNLYYMEEKYREAAADYQSAIQADPKDPLILINLAKAYKVQGDTARAKSAYLKAQELDPSIKKRYKTLSIELLGKR